jgi:hypothetical protein
MRTDAQRMAAQRQRRLKAGLTQIALWIPIERKASFLSAAQQVREDPCLEADVRKARTGVLVSLDPAAGA